MGAVGDELPHPVEVPHVVLVHRTGQWLPRDRVALVGQLAVAVHHVVAATGELGGDGGLAGPGDPLHEVVAHAHPPIVARGARLG